MAELPEPAWRTLFGVGMGHLAGGVKADAGPRRDHATVGKGMEF